MINDVQEALSFKNKNPNVDDDFSYFEKTREEKMEHWWKRFKTVMEDDEYHKFFTSNSSTDRYSFNWHYLYQGVSPLHLH